MQRTISLAGMAPGEGVCVHVEAVDRVQNSAADQVSCAAPLVSPPMPAWTAPDVSVAENPARVGLVGLDTWFWLAPGPMTLTVDETYLGTRYLMTAKPIAAGWALRRGTSIQPTHPPS